MFALTPCLSDDYKGGYPNLPEYGRRLYRPPAGGAMVFSISLLHAVMDATGGRRFTIIIFFFGELEFRGRKVRHEQTRAVGREAEFDQT